MQRLLLVVSIIVLSVGRGQAAEVVLTAQQYDHLADKIGDYYERSVRALPERLSAADSRLVSQIFLTLLQHRVPPHAEAEHDLHVTEAQRSVFERDHPNEARVAADRLSRRYAQLLDEVDQKFVVPPMVIGKRAAEVYGIVETADREGRPLLLFFTASDCAVCTKTEKQTLNDSRVREVLQHAQFVKVDATDANDLSVNSLRNHYAVGSLPALVLVRAGHAVRRLEGTISATQILSAMRR